MKTNLPFSTREFFCAKQREQARKYRKPFSLLAAKPIFASKSNSRKSVFAADLSVVNLHV